MTPQQFESENEHRWKRLEQVLDAVEKKQDHEDVERLPTLFRQVCHDLSLAQHRLYGMRLVERLNRLAISGYRLLERRVSGGWEVLFRLVGRDFPRALRAEKRLFGWMLLAFWGPFLFFALSTAVDPEWSMRLLGTEQMLQLEAMYGKNTSPTDYMREEFGSNFMMFAFYIFNNVGIGLRAFGAGLLAGVGSLFMVLFNGAYIGACTGYIHQACNPETFYSFVAGHSAPELIGIVIAGTAGLRLGLALIHPGAYSRRTALVLAGRKALVLLLGAVFLISLAAVIEGFWSANPMAPWIKYSFGITVWILTIGYLVLAGRRTKDEA